MSSWGAHPDVHSFHRRLVATTLPQRFTEVCRVTEPGGTIIYNATWLPGHSDVRRFDTRIRQQQDFWGCSSIAALYRRIARSVRELFDAYEYESVKRYPKESPFWSEAFDPATLSTEHHTDPRIVSSHPSHREYCCPLCGCNQLRHLTDDFMETDGRYPVYECLNCGYRTEHNEVVKLANAIQTQADKQGCAPGEVEEVSHTPGAVEHELDRLRSADGTRSSPLSPALPWVPAEQYNKATADTPDSQHPEEASNGGEATALIEAAQHEDQATLSAFDNATSSGASPPANPPLPVDGPAQTP